MTGFIEIETEFSHATSTGTRYKVFHSDELLLESARDPLHDAARALIAAGADPDDTLIERKRGEPMICMSGRLAYLAATTTTEGQQSGPRTVPWAPYSGPATAEDQ